MKKRGIVVAILLTLVAMLAVACGGGGKTSGGNQSGSGDKQQSLVTIKAGHQPSYHAVPTWIAVQKGWDKAEGLEIKIVDFPSGPPQNEALASGQWEVGAEGCVPAMLAALRYGAYIIAISNDESETNDLWVRPDSDILKVKGYNPKYPDIYGSPETVKGKTVLVTTASTGHYALLATLKALGLKESDVKIVHMEVAQSLAAFQAGQGDIMQSWAVTDYLAQEKGFVKMSSGRRAGVVIPGAVVASKKAVEEHPELVAKWLKLYIKGIDLMKTNPEEGKQYEDSWVKSRGLTISKQALDTEFKERPIYNTQEQLKLFDKSGGQSQVEKWFSEIADFFVDQGRITPQEKEQFLKGNYITDKILKMVAEEEAKEGKAGK